MENINTLIFWWSVLSTALSILLLCWDVWQVASSKKEKELQKAQLDLHKSQVKIWQHHAEGLMHGLISIRDNKFSSVEDVKYAVLISQAIAYSLRSSLNEERLFTEEEIKEKQLKTELAWQANATARQAPQSTEPKIDTQL